MQKQVREESPEPLSVQGDRAAVLDDRQWAENAEFDGNTAFVALPCPDEQARAVRDGLGAVATLRQ
jgi:hypothetical protein